MEIKYFNLSTSLLFLILALILFIKRSPNKKSNNFLAILFVLIALYSELVSLHFDFVQTNNLSYLSYYLPIDALLLMLMSPCLYFYVLSLLNRPVKLIHWSTLLHLTPLLPCLIFDLIFSLRPAADRINWLIHDFYSGSMEMTIINAVLYLQIIFYLIISYQAVRIQKRVSVYIEKNGFRTNITWVRLFLLINIIVILLSLPVCFLINNERTSIFIGHTAMNIDLIFLFIMTALKIGSIDTEKMEEKKISYKINETQAASYWKTLTEYMDICKPYRDESCSIRSLAEQTNIPEYQLSKILNAHGGISFTDFIIEYRLKEAVIYLEDRSKQRKNIDTIALVCGFGSRSSFYRAFDKVYSISPSAYRKQHDSNHNA
jgi:AraC-like DNA-binding protein